MANTPNKPEDDDLELDMEAVKYFLWLDPDRCGMFFAPRVLIVEGPTEKVFLEYLIEKDKLRIPAGSIFILEAMGKFNIHRFMNICGKLNIPHSVLFDGDLGKPEHKNFNELINKSRNSFTYKVGDFKNDIETFLGVKKTKHQHRKPQHILYKYTQNQITEDKVDELVKVVEDLLN